MLKCDPKAFAQCPTRHLCGTPDEATFAEESECDKFNRKVQFRPMTKADRIRALRDEELADILNSLYLVLSDEGYFDFGKMFCDGKAGCITEDGDIICDDTRRKACIVRWLQRPAEENEYAKDNL